MQSQEEMLSLIEEAKAKRDIQPMIVFVGISSRGRRLVLDFAMHATDEECAGPWLLAVAKTPDEAEALAEKLGKELHIPTFKRHHEHVLHVDRDYKG